MPKNDYTLPEVAGLLNKNLRQVRYLVRSGQIPARKDGARWLVKKSDLDVAPTAPQAAAVARAEAAAENAADAAAENAADAAAENAAPNAAPNAADAAAEASAVRRAAGRRYSVGDLNVFQAGEVLFREMVDAVGPAHPMSRRLRAALEAVALGCHVYEPEEKLELFRQARRDLAATVAGLLLGDAPPTDAERAFATRIEQVLIPQLGGLIRAADRSAHGRRTDRARARFQSFGARRG